MNKQESEKKSEIRNRRRRPKLLTRRNSSSASYHVRSAAEEPLMEADAIRPIRLRTAGSRSFPAKTNEIHDHEEGQPLDQLHPVQSYDPTSAADGSEQADHTPNTSRIRRTSTDASKQSAATHYSDAISEDVVNEEEQVIDAEIPAFSQTTSIKYDSNASMHKQDATRVHNQTSRAAASLHVILFQGNGKTKSMKQQAFFYQAAMKGDWKAAEGVLREDKRLASLSITQSGETALHVAAATKRVKLVLTDDHGNTAFCFAAASGVVKIAELMYEKNNGLPTIRGSEGMTPLYMAALLGNKEMVSYLYNITPRENLRPEEHNSLFEAAADIGMFDLAVKILNAAGSSTDITLEKKTSALKTLARKPSAPTGYCQDCLWRRFLSVIHALQCIPWMKRIHDNILQRIEAKKLVQQLLREISELHDDGAHIIETNILHDAVKVGNVEFLAMLFRSYPELISRLDDNGHSIFHVAVAHRQENVFNLIYDIGAYKDLIVLSVDNNENNILHLAAKLATRNRLETVSGAALQMQRELQWFKEVEKIVPPSYLKMRNECLINEKPRELTPRELFSEEHHNLLEKGEKWMKDTANSCMLVATLIATVVFAAAFTVPGGSNNDTGIPVFLRARWFEVFVISDAVAMFTSTTSIIVFLSILTSRYAEDDFLSSLPKKLMLGLTALFISILGMVVAFASTFILIYNGQRVWVPKLIGAFACIPVAVFALLQYKLWIDTFRSTYWSKFLFRPSKHKLYD